MILKNIVENLVVETEYVLEFTFGNAVLERRQVDDRTWEQQFAVRLLEQLEQILDALVDSHHSLELLVGHMIRRPFAYDVEQDLDVERIQLGLVEHVFQDELLMCANASFVLLEPILYD